MAMDSKATKKLKKLAHHLKPIISIGERGVSSGVLAEIDRGLSDHELIKIKLHSNRRSERATITEELVKSCSANLVQKIGKTIVLYKKNPDAKIKLSNISGIDLA